MTGGLMEFLRTRLDEDHKLAFEAGDGGHDVWTFDPELTWNGSEGPREAVVRFNGSALGYVAAVDPVHGKYGTWNAKHMAQWDPARVLAEVDAKRRILRQHRQTMSGWCVTCDIPGDSRGNLYGCETIRVLALPYRDHPDYQPEWAPNAEG